MPAAPSVTFFRMLSLLLGLGLAGCTGNKQAQRQDDAPRARLDEILSPSGSTPGDAYAKRSRYDGQDFRSKQLASKPFKSGSRTYKGNTEFNASAYQKKSPLSQRSRFQDQTSPMADDQARTFSSRYQGQEARTKDYGQADKNYATGEARVADKSFYSGRNRYYAPGERELGPSQLSRSSASTANVYPGSSMEPLNVEDVRRVLNKGPKPE